MNPVHPAFCPTLPLAGDEIHLVHIAVDVERDLGPSMALLDDEEQRRAGRFVRECDRRQFAVTHTVTRVTLARCVGVPPKDIRFERGSHGKPRLAGAAARIRFNLSHAGDRALLAIAAGREVGVDVEQERIVEVFGLARHVFSPREIESLRRLAPADRLGAFFRGWTRKESFIKARGDGLWFPLKDLDVSLDENPSQVLLACRSAPGEFDRWTMRPLPCDRGYQAALTVEGSGWRVTDWDAPDLA
jgi:4'-phosphopantetheinyl transferase